MKRSNIAALLLLTILLLSFLEVFSRPPSTSASGTVIRVPQDYPTIQEAINHSGGGDIVLVGPGVYYEHLSLPSMSLAIVGENAAATIVDGGGSGIVFDMGMGSRVTISGLTIRNGEVGICMEFYSGSFQLNNSIVLKNKIGIQFVNLACTAPNTLICHNSFVNNTQQAVVGATYFKPLWDNGYPSGGNYWSDYNGTDANHDGIGDTPYVIDANNVDHYPLMNPWVPVTDLASLAVRGQNNIIYYRTFNVTTASWAGWNALPGATCDSPAAALCNNELHTVVRGMDGNTLWHGYVSLMNGVFSGWTLLSGSTPSAPTLTSNGTVLGLVVRGSDSRVYYRVYSFSPSRSWGSWNALTGTTIDSPAAAMLGNNLHVVVRSSDGSSLYHIVVQPNTGVVRNWILLSGATPSKPVLAANQTANKLYLTVRGADNKIYWRTYDGAADSWASWNLIPTGTTGDAPAATILNNKLHIVVRGTGGTTLWHGYTDLSTGTFSGWTLLSGSTPSAPTLTS